MTALALRPSEYLDTQPVKRPASVMQNRLKNVASACEPSHMAERGMYSTTNEKFFGLDAHRARLAAALRKRFRAGISPKHVADALGISVETVRNWANGYSDPSSHRVGLLFQFFGNLEHSPAFWVEVYGHIGGAMKKRFEARKEADLLRLEAEETILNVLTGTEP